jgi:lipid-A-disaccharide synthase
MRVALVAGESSGDLLGAGLIREIRKSIPGTTFEGVAGPTMAACGCIVLEDADTLAVMGLVEPLTRIPKLRRLRRSLVERWTDDPPDVFVGIDAPDFNLGLAKRLRRAGVKTIQYVCPSVWAWRQGRVKKLSVAADRVLCLLPFEQKFLDEHDVACDFVGHPMADRMPVNPDADIARQRSGAVGSPIVAILPGSRMSEVTRLGPVFAEAARLLTTRYPDIGFIAPMATPEIRDCFRRTISDETLARMVLTDGEAETAVSVADVVLLASGTATLQTALLGKPMVVAYRLAALTYAIVKLFDLVKIPYVSLPNLLTDTPLVPEYIQNDATPENLANEVALLLGDDARRALIASTFGTFRARLARDADRRAADAVIDMATGHAG